MADTTHTVEVGETVRLGEMILTRTATGFDVTLAPEGPKVEVRRDSDRWIVETEDAPGIGWSTAECFPAT